MRSMKRGMFVCLGIVLAALSAWAEDEKAAPVPGSPNVRLTIEIGRIENGAKISVSSYEFMTAANDQASEISAGSRIPIATATASSAQAASEGKSAMTSFSFQNIDARIRARIDVGGWIKIAGRVDASDKIANHASGDPASPPVVSQLHQEINVRLRDGKPSRIVAINEPGRASSYVEIKADLVD